MKMKSLYLILVITIAAVTCEPQHTNNDIIWYPVDDEDGVFISTIGEKYRTTPNPKWRSHRTPRYSGMEKPLPLSYDPTENYDPSFFNNINERRPYVENPTVQKAPLYNQQFVNYRPNNRPQSQQNQIPNEEFQEIIIEVFDYNKQPQTNGYPGNNQWNNRPVTGNQNQWNNQLVSGNQNQWNNRPVTGNQNQWNNQRPNQNQWGGNPFFGNTNQWNGGQRPAQSNQWGGNFGSGNGNQGQRPTASNQWGGSSGSLIHVQRPDTSNQWGSTSGSRPFEKPTNSEWIVNPSDTNRPNNRPNRPSEESDKLVFPGESSFTTTTSSSVDVIPVDPPTRSPCENMCPVTPEFNPVCGSDLVTYSNAGRLKCAQMCGKDVRLSHYGSCGRTPFITPLVSNNHKKKFSEFW